MKKPKKSANMAGALADTDVSGGSQWLKSAAHLARVLDSGSWRSRYPSEALWYRHMSETQGYNAATLRRQVRLLRFLERQLGHKKLSALGSSHIPMGALELLMRMRELSPARADALFDEVMTGAVSYRSLKAEYDLLVRNAGRRASPRQQAPRRAARFEENVAKFIQKYPDPYVGQRQAKFFRTSQNRLPGFPFELADLSAVLLDGENNAIGIVGFDIRLISGEKNSASTSVSRILESIGFRADFFQVYWTFIQEDRGNNVAARLAEYLQLAGRGAVGVVSVEPDAAEGLPTRGRVSILKLPSLEGPVVGRSEAQRRVIDSLNRVESLAPE